MRAHREHRYRRQEGLKSTSFFTFCGGLGEPSDSLTPKGPFWALGQSYYDLDHGEPTDD